MAFSQSSENIEIIGEERNILRAYCHDKNGSGHISSIDLNSYLGNINGEFRWGGHNFTRSAVNVILKGATLYADLQREDGTWNNATTVHLDDHITNNDGRLEYMG
jgi:hypothetical protein